MWQSINEKVFNINMNTTYLECNICLSEEHDKGTDAKIKG